MELGNWALISSPSLLALLPLIFFIVFALLGKGNYLGMFLGIIVGFFLTGQDLVSLTNAYTAAISSSTTVMSAALPGSRVPLSRSPKMAAGRAVIL